MRIALANPIEGNFSFLFGSSELSVLPALTEDRIVALHNISLVAVRRGGVPVSCGSCVGEFQNFIQGICKSGQLSIRKAWRHSII